MRTASFSFLFIYASNECFINTNRVSMRGKVCRDCYSIQTGLVVCVRGNIRLEEGHVNLTVQREPNFWAKTMIVR